MSQRVLIVGINPSNLKADRSTTWRRLPAWADRLGLDIFAFTNCIPNQGKYSHKDIDYDILAACTVGHEKVIALGNFVSKALEKINVEHFILPHPSGLNRKLNDKAYEDEMLLLCEEYLNV